MAKNLNLKKCNNIKSVFDYSLLLEPNGAIKLFDKKGEPLSIKATTRTPRIKEILNVRTLTVVEAKGSSWIWISSLGMWIQI